MSIQRRSLIVGVGAAALLPASVTRGTTPPVRIPIELTESRVLVDCSIGGRGPFQFLIDTGGTIGLIDMKLAEKLKLKMLGQTTLALTVGRKPYPILEVPDFEFGGQLRQPRAAFAGVEDFGFGGGAVGSLAAGVLTAADGELDFEMREWRIYQDGSPDRTGWTRYERAIVHHGNRNGSAFMFADVVLGGRSFRFGLDTGMPNSTRVYRKAAEAMGLWDGPRWSPTAPGGKGRMVRAPAFELAGATIEGVMVTMLDRPEWGVFDAGIVGLPLLRRFNIATGAAEGAVYLKRNGLGPQSERYNRAGIWIERDGKETKVGVVGAGSPAEEAGLERGDRLIGADFDALIDRMYDPAGTKIALTVEHAGVRRDLTLTLADYL
ncbi:aspartyl protease family protein [Sphingomonas sp. PL-96]|uniref:retropepsin-like aspartic protease n=1 Tax=Sphingomonas sp. PL-96 TaxID=2887201 RepID=UPI001E30A559|nr:aspartyl protease family protein [Sphingomonas sp. PL-96]MCC2978277.1 aspartyl protease family protein [Sphingomonas sp. PL-96]